MNIKLLSRHRLECLSLKGGCIGSSEYTLAKMPHCWKSRAVAEIYLSHDMGFPTMWHVQPAQAQASLRIGVQSYQSLCWLLDYLLEISCHGPFILVLTFPPCNGVAVEDVVHLIPVSLLPLQTSQNRGSHLKIKTQKYRAMICNFKIYLSFPHPNPGPEVIKLFYAQLN